MELTRLKKRLKTATRGHKLLKDKRDEMVRRFIELVKKQRELRMNCEKSLTEAMDGFAGIKAEMGDSSVNEALLYPVREAKVSTGTANIMSVEVPTLRLEDIGSSMDLSYSFAFTSSELDDSVLHLAGILPSLIHLAETEKTCNMLADEIEKTRRRVNALEHVMIPEMEGQIRFIKMKLDENERSATTRLMKVKDIINQQA